MNRHEVQALSLSFGPTTTTPGAPLRKFAGGAYIIVLLHRTIHCLSTYVPLFHAFGASYNCHLHAKGNPCPTRLQGQWLGGPRDSTHALEGRPQGGAATTSPRLASTRRWLQGTQLLGSKTVGYAWSSKQTLACPNCSDSVAGEDATGEGRRTVH